MFIIRKLKKKVSDITYLWTNEGWLYGNYFKTQEEARAAVFEYVDYASLRCLFYCGKVNRYDLIKLDFGDFIPSMMKKGNE